MKEIKKLLKLPEADYYETHLSLVNCVLPVTMTPMELKVIAAFMALKGDIALVRFGPSAKKLVMKQLNITPSGMSNYIGQLIEKGFLYKQGDIMNILPILIPESTEQIYIFKLQNNGTLSSNTT